MKKALILTLFIPLQMITYQVCAQNLFLESINEIIISPDDVNIHYEEQIDYYSEKHQTFIDYLAETKASNQSEIEQIQSKEKIKRKDYKKIKALEQSITVLDEEISLLENCIVAWSNLEISGNDKFDQLSSTKCYNIETEKYIYSPEKYTILEVYPDEKLSWYERAESTEQKEVDTLTTGITTKWVKKKRDNCVSQKPDDCLMWCLVQVPMTQTIHKRMQVCPLEFEYREGVCIKEVNADNKNTTTKRLRIIDINTLTEIHPIGFEESDCK